MPDAPTVAPVLDKATERQLRTAANKVREQTKRRNDLIVTAHNAGASLREIAAAVDMDHTSVRKIVQKVIIPVSMITDLANDLYGDDR